VRDRSLSPKPTRIIGTRYLRKRKNDSSRGHRRPRGEDRYLANGLPGLTCRRELKANEPKNYRRPIQTPQSRRPCWLGRNAHRPWYGCRNVLERSHHLDGAIGTPDYTCAMEGCSFVSVECTSCDGREDRQQNSYRSRTCSRSVGGSGTARER